MASALFLACLFVAPQSSNASYSFIPLNYPGAVSTEAHGIDDGKIVGFYGDGSTSHGFIYDGVTWTSLNYPGADWTKAYGIDGGNIVGQYGTASGSHGFIYNGTAWTSLSYPEATSTYISGIDGGNIVGHYSGPSAPDRGSYKYNGTTWSRLTCPGYGSMTFAADIDGSTIVGWDAELFGPYDGWKYDGSMWTALEFPGAANTVPRGIDGDNIVGYYQNSLYSGPSYGFIYDGTTWTSLNYPGAANTYALGVDGGNIVGFYWDGFGYNGFFATQDDSQSFRPGMSMIYSGRDTWLILSYTAYNQISGKYLVYLKVMDTDSNPVPAQNITGLSENPYLVADDAIKSDVSLAFDSNAGTATVTFTDSAGLALVRITDIYQPTYDLSGEVRTSDSLAISGVTMNLSGNVTRSVTTDGNGNYSFGTLLNGSYTITPGKPTCTFNPPNIPVELNGNDMTGQDFVGICGNTISGTVQSYKGTPTAGVTITLSGAKSAMTTTDESGNYSFIGLSNGSYTVKPSKAGTGFSPYSATKTINGANATQNFTSYP